MTHPPALIAGPSGFCSEIRHSKPLPKQDRFSPSRGDSQPILKPADLISQQSTPDSTAPRQRETKILLSETIFQNPHPKSKAWNRKPQLSYTPKQKLRKPSSAPVSLLPLISAPDGKLGQTLEIWATARGPQALFYRERLEPTEFH